MSLDPVTSPCWLNTEYRSRAWHQGPPCVSLQPWTEFAALFSLLLILPDSSLRVRLVHRSRAFLISVLILGTICSLHWESRLDLGRTWDSCFFWVTIHFNMEQGVSVSLILNSSKIEVSVPKPVQATTSFIFQWKKRNFQLKCII